MNNFTTAICRAVRYDTPIILWVLGIQTQVALR